jgi:hypothetical protein
MSAFTAVILVCQLSTTPPQACDEAHAIDVISTHVESQFACLHGWQEGVARGALREGVGDTLYIKTLCRRNAQAASLFQDLSLPQDATPQK